MYTPAVSPAHTLCFDLALSPTYPLDHSLLTLLQVLPTHLVLSVTSTRWQVLHSCSIVPTALPVHLVAPLRLLHRYGRTCWCILTVNLPIRSLCWYGRSTEAVVLPLQYRFPAWSWLSRFHSSHLRHPHHVVSGCPPIVFYKHPFSCKSLSFVLCLLIPLWTSRCYHPRNLSSTVKSISSPRCAIIKNMHLDPLLNATVSNRSISGCWII